MRELRALALSLILLVSLVSPVAATGAPSLTESCTDHPLVAAAANGTLPADPGVYVVVCDATGTAVPYAPVVVTADGNYSADSQLFLTDEGGVAVLPVADEDLSLDAFAFTPTGDRASAVEEPELLANETIVIGLALADSPNQSPGGTSLSLADPLGAYALPEDAEPGDLVMVRTVVLVPSSENRLSIADTYDSEGAFDIDLHEILVGGGNATVVLEFDEDERVDVAVEDVDGGVVITLLTNVTIPADATVGDTIEVSGMINTTDGDSFVAPVSFGIVAPPAPPAPNPSPSPSPSPGPSGGPSAGPTTGGSSGGSGGSSGGSSSGGSAAAVEPVEPSAVVTFDNGGAFGQVRNLDGSLDVPVGYEVDGIAADSMLVTSADADFEFDLRFADRPGAGVSPFTVGQRVPLAYLIAGHSSESFDGAMLTISIDAALVEDPEALRLYRYDGSWTALDTTFVYESDGRYVYAVETSDLGTFAVAAPGDRPYALTGVARPATDGSGDHTLFLSVGYEGRASGALDLVLTVNGELTDIERAHFLPGETKTVQFDVETRGHGTYALSVNGLAIDTIEIVEASEPRAITPTPDPVPTETPAEDIPAGGSFPTAAVVGGVALIALAAGAFLVLRR